MIGKGGKKIRLAGMAGIARFRRETKISQLQLPDDCAHICLGEKCLFLPQREISGDEQSRRCQDEDEERQPA